MDQLGQWLDDRWCPRCDGQAHWLDGGADVAETTYTAFAGTRHETTARLIIRRVRPTPGSQLAMDVVFSYHAILSDRDGPLLAVEADHRRHAIVEHTICDLKHHAGLAHLPLGGFRQRRLARARRRRLQPRERTANAGLGRVTTKTLRVTVIAVPARLRLGTPGPERAFDHSTRDPRG